MASVVVRIVAMTLHGAALCLDNIENVFMDFVGEILINSPLWDDCCCCSRKNQKWVGS